MILLEVFIAKSVGFFKAINIFSKTWDWGVDMTKRIKQDGLSCPYCNYKTLQKSHEKPWNLNNSSGIVIISNKYHTNYYVCARKKCRSSGKPISDAEIVEHIRLRQAKN